MITASACMRGKPSSEGSNFSSTAAHPTPVRKDFRRQPYREPRFGLGVLALCLTISGAASLVLEIVWMRELRLAFGSTTLASSTILVAYMFGLGAGGWLGGRIAGRLAKPLRTYGALEIVVGTYALAVPWVCRSLIAETGAWFVELSFWQASVFRFFVSQLLLLAPTIAMGATLPLVVQAAEATGARAGRTSALLYGANTLGAVTGVFLGTFFFLPSLGSTGANTAAALADVFLGSAVVLWSRLAHAPKPQEFPGAAPERPAGSLSPLGLGSASPALFAYAIVGFVGLAFEVCWTRALASVFGSSVYAFGAMLGSFLTGIALGSFAMHRLIERLPSIAVVATVLVLLLSATSIVTFHLLFLLPEWFPRVFVQLGGTYEASVGASILLTLVALLPPTLILGALFPTLVVVIAREEGTAARSVGRVYWWNTLGSGLGAFAGGFLLLPAFGLQKSLALLATATALTAAILALWQRERRGPWRVALVILAGALVLVIWSGGLRASPEALTSGVFRFPIAEIDVGVRPVALRGPAEGEVLFYRDGWNATVSVHRVLGELSLRVNGKADASARGDLPTQVLLGHLGYFFRPDARDVAVIGLASGVTAGSATLYPGKRIDVIEIEPAMVEASRFFEHLNNRPLEHPSVRLVLDDARTYLASKEAAYDLVLSEPSNPWMAGSANLFTREFFRTVRRALRPRGLLVQWVQLYAMPEDAVAAVLRGLAKTFPHVYGFAPGHGNTDLLLVAGREPIQARDFPAWDQLPANARTDLVRAGVFDGDDLRALLYLPPAAVEAMARRAPVVNTDDNMFVELTGSRALYMPPTEPANWFLIDSHANDVAAFWRQAHDDRALAELALAYLRRGAIAVAQSLVATAVGNRQEPLVRAVNAEIEFRAKGPSGEALDRLVTELRQVLSLVPESYSARYLLATAEHDRQEPVHALAQIEEGLRTRPGDLRLRRLRLRVLLALGRATEAHQEANELLATRLKDRDMDLYRDAAQAAAQAGDLPQALRLTEAYLDHHPDSPEAWNSLADIYRRLGQQEAAAEAQAKAEQAKRNVILSLHRQARQLAIAGDLEGAITQLRTILLFDPSYVAARRDLQTLQQGEDLEF